MKQEFKRGISLIAVLMFMLAATTASIVVYKLIGSENFASGSRLKQTEAYQAAESGVEATQAWLSSKGADVGALMTAYFDPEQPKPIRLTNVLSMVRSNTETERQNFEVHLVGIDTSSANAPYHKFKFISVGRARDNSEVKLTAIFDVAGLYQTKVPSIVTIKSGVPTKVPPYHGGSISFSGEKRFSGATVNGNWTGNPPLIDEDFVVTGNLVNSGNSVEVGGTLCVGGTYDTNNDKVKVNDAYIGNSTTFLGKYENVYCEGDMAMKNTGIGVNINGSLTLNGILTFTGGASYPVKGDMVIGDTAYINSNGIGAGNNFSVCGSVLSSSDSAGVRGTNSDGTKILFNTCNNNNSILAFKNAVSPTNNGVYRTYKSNNLTTPVGSFTSLKPNADYSLNTSKVPGAIAVKEYCDNNWRPATSSDCSFQNEGAKFVVDDPISSSLSDIEKFLNEKNGKDNTKSGNFQCISNITHEPRSNNGVPADTVKAINECYEKLKNSDKLYNGYLIVKINQTESYSFSTPLKGKFIFIYPETQSYVFLPATTKDSKVMVFFKEGVSNELRSNKCVPDGQGGNHAYNYFIYSLKSIERLNEWSDECPLEGNIYFPTNTCAKIVNVNNNFSLMANEELIQDLMGSGILCRRGGGTGDCTDTERENTIHGQPGEEGGEENASYDFERFWLPVSSRLKVSLVSKNISREKIDETGNPDLKHSAIVMPRIVRLTKDAFTAFPSDQDPLQRFYTFMYLNGAQASTPPPRNCVPVNGGIGELKPTGTLTEGFFRCGFGENSMYSDFYVVVKGITGGAAVQFDRKNEPAEEDKCGTVNVVATENHKSFSLNIVANPIVTNWNIDLINVSSKCNAPPSQSGTWVISCNEELLDGTIATIKACINNPNDEFVRLEIQGVDGIDLGSITESFITRNKQTMNILRDDIEENIVRCPSDIRGTEWITLICSVGTTEVLNVDEVWTCEAADGQSAVYTIHKLGEEYGCELPQGKSPTGNVQIPPDYVPDIHFQADLAWKKRRVTVTGGTLAFTTTSTAVPANERSSPGQVSTFDIYHGAVYQISSSEPREVSCNPEEACLSKPMYVSSNMGGAIRATSAVAITLKEIPNPVAECEQTIPKQRQNIPFTFGGIAPLSNIQGYGCDNNAQGAISYSYSKNGTVLNPNPIPENESVSLSEIGTYGVTATIRCGEKTGTAICGNLEVVDALEPDIACTWEDGSTGSKNWYEGDYPKLRVVVTNGDLKICENPTLSGELSAAGWGRIGTQSQTRGVSSTHTFTSSINLKDSDTGPHSAGSIKANVTCGGTPFSNNCPAFDVLDKKPCDVIDNFSNICPNTQWPNGVKWNTRPTPSGGGQTTQGCYYVKEIGNKINNDNDVVLKINGKSFPKGYYDKSNNNLNLPGKVDDGYYIYVGTANVWADIEVATTGSKPECVPAPEPSLSCSWTEASSQAGRFLKNGAIEDGPISVPTVTCDGTPINISNVTFSETPWLNATAKEYNNITATTAACGTSSKNANCGSLRVRNAPAINSCTGTTSQTVTLPAKPTQPSVTLTDPSSVCPSGLTSIAWTVSKNGTNVNNGTWINIFDVAGQYSNYSVKGKCGNYPKDLESTCSGNATVNPDPARITIATGKWDDSYNSSGGTSIPIGTYTNINCTKPDAPVRCYMTQNQSIIVNGGSTITAQACRSPTTSFCHQLTASCSSLTSLQILKAGVTCMNEY